MTDRTDKQKYSGCVGDAAAGQRSGSKGTIRLGTRKSALAMAQTRLAAWAISEAAPDISVEIIPFVTTGDRLIHKPLTDFGGKGVFISELEQALLDGSIDAAVHSAKDLPMELAEGLRLSAVLNRGEPGDVLVVKRGEWNRLFGGDGKETVVVGTGSLRRQAQISRLYPQASCIPLRGNVDTRLNKLFSGQCDAVILAAAGLSRLNAFSDDRFDFFLMPEKEFLPAGGQGIIALESREDSNYNPIFSKISHGPTWRALLAEREVLMRLGAGCHETVGVYGWEEKDQFHLKAMRETKGGLVYREIAGRREDCLELAEELAAELAAELAEG